MTMLSRRTLLQLAAAGGAVPFLRARAATVPGTLRFGLSTYPPNLFPWANVGTAGATAKLAIHRGLLGYAPDGSLRGELAESWAADGDTAWVFHLRQAVFHNGDPVTADDVKWTFDQVAGEKSTAYLRTDLQRFVRVEAPDQRTIRVVLPAPNVTLPYLMASYFLPIVQKGSTENGGLGMGAGPFLLKSQERGVAMEFTPFDKYYRPGLPRLQSIRMVAYADENLRATALQAGDVDLIEYVPFPAMQAIGDDPGLRLQTTQGPFMYMTFNGRTGPFVNPLVRQAVALAIRREDVVKAAFFGRGAPLEGLPIDPQSPFFDPALAKGWAYDPARAKALLSQAGVPDGFACTLLGTTTYGMHKDTAQVVQQHLSEIGIKVELNLPDWATRVAIGNRGQYEFSVQGTAADSNDPDGLSPLIAGGLAPSYARSFGVSVPGLDDKLAAGRAEFDMAKRRAIYEDVQRLSLEGAPIAGLAWRSQGYGFAKGVTGFQNLPGALSFYSGTTLETVAIA